MVKSSRKLIFISLLTLYISFSTLAHADQSRKIVVFKDTFVSSSGQEALLKNVGGVLIKPLRLVNGSAAYLSPQVENALLGRPEILRIENDVIVKAIGKSQTVSQPVEELPWGIDRINADLAWPTTSGFGIKVAVIDTGIDLDHPDLRSNIKGQVNTINPRKTAEDDNGHGTHVAGTIAALDNTIGVIGVGPQIDLYAVKSLDRTGSGWLSDIIEGLEWCINNRMQVVNMSLGMSSDSLTFHEALIRAYNDGIVLVAAAGNNGQTDGAISYPARYSEVIAVSAVDSNGFLASFSSYGPEIDLAAPGVQIRSTYRGDTYRILNGTSMAAPHVVGAASLVLTTSVGLYDQDGDGVWDPLEVQGKLEATAENLGLSADQQGKGLVRADLATQ